MPATCWNCKTPKMMHYIKEYGDEFWAKDFNEFRENFDEDKVYDGNTTVTEAMQCGVNYTLILFWRESRS